METTTTNATSDAVGAVLAGGFCVLYICLAIIGLVGFIIWIISLIDVLRKSDEDFKNSNERLLWVLIVLLGGWIGGVVYYFMVYRKNNKKK